MWRTGKWPSPMTSTGSIQCPKRRPRRRSPARPQPSRSSFLPAAAAAGAGFGLGLLGGRVAAGAAHVEEFAHRVARDGAAVKPALRFRAAIFRKRAADLLGFDALGADRHVECVAEPGDSVDDLGSALAFDDGRDEALVDFDAVEWQAVDLGQARIAGAEIVERDAHADVLEAFDDAQHLLAVLEQEPSVISSSSRLAGNPLLASNFRICSA